MEKLQNLHLKKHNRISSNQWLDIQSFVICCKLKIGKLFFQKKTLLIHNFKRHNGNILLDANGYIIHIDFGYLLSKTIKFENAPFKLTTEFVEVMGGYNSPAYKQYCRLCVQGYLAARKQHQKIISLIEMTLEGEKSAKKNTFLLNLFVC